VKARGRSQTKWASDIVLGGNLGEQETRLYEVKNAKLNDRRGGGIWGDQARRPDRQRRQRERQEKREGSLLWRLPSRL
jgi:hypothetical protein